jgi:hypothetical protein
MQSLVELGQPLFGFRRTRLPADTKYSEIGRSTAGVISVLLRFSEIKKNGIELKAHCWLALQVA